MELQKSFKRLIKN